MTTMNPSPTLEVIQHSAKNYAAARTPSSHLSRNQITMTRGQRAWAAASNREADVALAAMCKHRRPGQTFTQQQIADVCGIQRGGIWFIERRALKKLVGKLRLAGYRDATVPNWTRRAALLQN